VNSPVDLKIAVEFWRTAFLVPALQTGMQSWRMCQMGGPPLSLAAQVELLEYGLRSGPAATSETNRSQPPVVIASLDWVSSR
jgi:hypothetical protein